MPVTLVQHKTQTDDGTLNGSYTVTLPATPSNGSLLVLAFGATGGILNESGQTIASITHTGATWSQITQRIHTASLTDIGVNTEIWAAPNVQNVGATITVNYSGVGTAGQGVTSDLSEFSAVRVESNRLDKTAGSDGALAATTDSGAATTNTGAQEVSVACIRCTGAVAPASGPTNSYIELMNTQHGVGFFFGQAAYRVFAAGVTSDPGTSYTYTVAPPTFAGCRASFFIAHGPPPTVKSQAVNRTGTY